MRYKWTAYVRAMFLDVIKPNGELEPIGSVTPHAHGWKWTVYNGYDKYSTGVCRTKWGAMAKLLRYLEL